MNQNFELDKQEVSYQEIIVLLKFNWKKIFLSSTLFLFLGFIYLFVVNPIYISTGSIIIEQENSTVSSIFDMGIGSETNYLDNEIEILRSRTTAEKAVGEILQTEKRNDLFLFDTKQYNYGRFPGKGVRGILRKILLLDWEKKEIQDIDKSVNDSLYAVFVDRLSENLTISNLRNTDVLKISYKSLEPEEAALIVNTVIKVYQQRDQDWANDEMSHLKNFLKDQLALKETELDKIEQQLKLFQEEEHIYSLDENSEILLNQLTLVESEYYTSLASKNILIERKKYIQSKLTEDEKEFANNVSNTLNSRLASSRSDLANLEGEYATVRSKEGETHPAAIKLLNKINSLKNNLKIDTDRYIDLGISVSDPIVYRQNLMDSLIQLDASIKNLDSKLIEVNELVEKYELELSELPSKFLTFSRLQRDKVILDETYTLMKQKYEESKINEASQLGKVRIVDPAIPILQQSNPNKKNVLLISFLFGVILSILYIIAKEYFDSKVKSIEDLERRGLNILALIPAIDSDKKRNRSKSKKNTSIINKPIRRLLTQEDPKSPISESYRSLRTSLMFNFNESRCKTILVSSSGPGEGKTTTVANLAITYANMNKKTLLIDADLRKPVIHKMFDLNKNLGLTNYIVDPTINKDDVIYKTEVENLNVIPCGIIPPNPSELLDSPTMKKFIDQIRKEFDVILFDSPPLIAVTDAVILKKYSDKFILVVRASGTEKGALDRVLVSFDNIGEQIDGAVFNDVNERNSYGGGYYYNYYQYYYGEENNG